MKRVVFVFFGGAWGSSSEARLKQWFGTIERWLLGRLQKYADEHEKSVKIEVLYVPSVGTTRAAYVKNALDALRSVNDGEAVAVAYSAGADLTRCVAQERPRLFRGAVFVGGLERGGLRWGRFLRALWHGWLPFLRGFLTGNVDIRGLRKVIIAFFGSSQADQSVLNLVEEKIDPEPMGAILPITPFRWIVGARKPAPFPAPIVAIVGLHDFFVGDATYAEETVTVLRSRSANHTLPLTKGHLLSGLGRAMTHIVRLLP